jgi:hypothetical protein
MNEVSEGKCLKDAGDRWDDIPYDIIQWNMGGHTGVVASTTGR